MEKNEQIDVLRGTLAETVERKRENTRARVAYKKATPVEDEMRLSNLLRYWRENNLLKAQIRAVGLAYAFLRGRSYWTTERVALTPPKALGIAAALGDPSREAEIKAWLEEKPSDEERLSFEAHLKAATEKARDERQARLAAKRAA
jgi:hypothetical protein